MYRHALVVGGTGMLARATIALAEQCSSLTLIARTFRSLSAVRDEIDDRRVEVRSLPLDWDAPERFLGAIRRLVQDSGPPDVMLFWLYDDALAVDLVQAAVPPSAHSRLIHVRSSRVHDPTRDLDATAARLATWPSVRYQQVVLGFVVSGTSSRWLTHAEIVAGALDALDHPDRSVVIVGTTSPWNMRP